MEYYDEDALFTLPTKQCLICEKVENPNATILDKGIPWICDDCRNKLRELIKEVKIPL